MSYEKLIKSENLCASLMQVNTHWRVRYSWRMECLVNTPELTCISTWAYIGKWVDFVLVSNCIKYGLKFQTHNSPCIAFIPYEKRKNKFCNNIFSLYFHLLDFSRFFFSNVQSQNDQCAYLERKKY